MGKPNGGPDDDAGSGFALHPHSDFRVNWDALSMIFLLYNADCPAGIWVFEVVIDWFFVLDIVLNFFTGVDVGGSVHTDQKYIVRHYLQTWFVIDFASSLPLDFVISLAFDGCPPDENVNSDNISYLKLIRILRLTKLLKLLRLLKLNSLLDTLQDQFPINQAVTKSMTLLCVVFYLAHITGCCWYAVGASAWGDYNASAVDDDFEAVSWLSTAGLTPDSALSERYTASLYWAFTTMTTVGYGDLIPQTSMERLFAVLAMMIGATVFGYVVGNATTIIANSDATSAQFHARMESLNQYMSERALPRALQVRIRKYFRYLYLKKTVFSNEEVILDDLSIQLRNELLLHMHRDLINQIRLFQRVTDPGFIDLMVRAMKPLFCSPEDVIVEEGKQGVEMYWLIKGNVEVLFAGVGKTINARAKGLLVDGSKPAAQPGGVEVEVEERASANFERSMSYKFDATTAVNLGTLRPGDYFGEIALMPLQAPGLEANRRTATVRALKNYCDLQAIGRETLLRCFSEFPEVEKEFFTLAKKRIEVLTDLDKQEDAVSSAGASMGSRGFTGLFYRPKDGQETFGTDMTAVISSLQQGIRLAEEESDVERRPCTRWHAMRLGTGHEEQDQDDKSDDDGDDEESLVDKMEDVTAMLRELEEGPQHQNTALPALRVALAAIEIAVRGMQQQSRQPARRASSTSVSSVTASLKDAAVASAPAAAEEPSTGPGGLQRIPASPRTPPAFGKTKSVTLPNFHVDVSGGNHGSAETSSISGDTTDVSESETTARARGIRKGATFSSQARKHISRKQLRHIQHPSKPITTERSERERSKSCA